MALWPMVGYDGAQQLNGVSTRFAAFGGDYQSNSDEPATQQEVRDTYTASNLRLYLSSWVGGAGVDDMIATFRVNGGDGNQTLTINATGEHEDTSNTDSLVSGDLINAEFDHSAGGHSDEYTMQTFQVTLDASSDVPPIMAAASWTADNDFAALQGALDDQATETDVEYTMRATRVLRDLRVYVIGAVSNTTITVRKNQVDTSLTVTSTGSGEFLDTSNTASFVAGDEANYGADDVAAGSVFSVRSVEADTSSGVQMWAPDIAGATELFFKPSATGVFGNTSEALVEIEAEDAATVQNLFVNCFTHAETRTIHTRHNQADGNCTLSITGTGLFEDTSNSDSLVADDDLAMSQDAGSSGANGYLIAVEWETGAVEAPTATGIPVFGAMVAVGSATAVVSAIGTPTFGAMVALATAAAAVAGVGVPAFGSMTVVGAAAVSPSAIGTPTFGAMTSVGVAAAAVSATGVPTFGAMTAVGTALHPFEATGVPIFGAMIVAGSATSAVSAVGIPTFGAMTSAGTATSVVSAAGVPTFGAMVATGDATAAVSATGVSTFGAMTATGDATAGVAPAAVGVPVFAAMVSTGSATAVVAGVGTPTFGAMTVVGSATSGVSAVGVSTFGAMTVVGTATSVVSATGTPTFAAMTAVGAALHPFEAVGIPTFGAMTAVGSAASAAISAIGTPTFGAMTVVSAAIASVSAVGVPIFGAMTATGAAANADVQAAQPDGTTAAGNWTAQPAGTLHANTADWSDSTYAQLLAADDPSTMILALETLQAPGSGNGTLRIRREFT